jgi:hypothetical protein
MQERLENDQLDRIFEYRALCLNTFYNRLNFFLIFESVLLGAIGLLNSGTMPSLSIVRAISVFGLALTLIWWYTQARQKYILYIATTYAQEVIPEYREILARTKNEVQPYLTWNLLTHAIPILTLSLWAILLIFFIR